MNIKAASLTEYAKHLMGRQIRVSDASPAADIAPTTPTTGGRPAGSIPTVAAPADGVTPTLLPPIRSIDQAAIDDIVRTGTFTDLAARLEPLFKEVGEGTVRYLLETRDADGDGLLSQAELGADDDRFAAIDADGDGLVSGDELRAHLKQGLAQAMLTDPTLDAALFSKQWIAAFDLNGDRAVDAAEVKLPPGIVGQIDADRDGRLTAAEVQADVERRGPAIGRRQRLEELAKHIGAKLDAAGFTHQPPVNIREIIGAFGLDKAAGNAVLRMLGDRYPQGLGVRTVA